MRNKVLWEDLIGKNNNAKHQLNDSFRVLSTRTIPAAGNREVVWVPSFDHFQIRTNAVFRFAYVRCAFFLDKIK